VTTLDAPTTLAATPAAAPRRNTLTSAGGIAMIAAPLLLTGGMLAIPPGEDGTSAGYVGSLAGTPWLTALSAGLLHYSWVFFALGVLAVPALVRGRGRALTGVVAVVTSFCSIQLSGLLLGDWFNMAAGRTVGNEQGAAIFDAVQGSDLWLSSWYWSGKIVGFVGILVLVLTLAYARAVSWWLVALPIVGTAAMMVLPDLLGLPGLAIATLIGFGPAAVIGAKLVRQR
jgi:hypothetical protein